MMTKNKRTRRLNELSLLLLTLDEMKSTYERMDKILAELVDAGEVGSFDLGREIVTIHDRFDKSNLAWKSTAIRRYYAERKVKKNDRSKKAS